MPPTIDTVTTAKVMVSPPRINLRRAASYNHDRGPLSSTSSRFNFNHLVFASPPPSPGLPQLLPPRPRKVSNAPRPSKVLRLALYVAGLVFFLYIAVSSVWGNETPRRLSNLGNALFSWPVDDFGADGELSYDMVGQNSLPGFATPVVVSDGKGNVKWTVSIPSKAGFPLSTFDYVDMCAKCHEVASRVHSQHHESRSNLGRIGSSLGDWTAALKQKLGGINGQRLFPSHPTQKHSPSFDQDFIDVHEAEVSGFLPGNVAISALLSQNDNDGHLVGEKENGLADRPVCDRSMTFVLESNDAGLGRTVMLMWMAYALAQDEGRQFFIDDTRWAYGKYLDIFAPPPVPSCRPPLRHEMLPCPRQARHLVITAETAHEFFLPPESYSSTSTGSGSGSNSGTLSQTTTTGSRTPPKGHTTHLFELAERGYKALFQLNDGDAGHADHSAEVLRNKTKIEWQDMTENRGTVVGMHVRRGDRRPLEFQYQDSYIPLNLYVERAHEVINGQRRNGLGAAAVQLAKGHSLMVLASDDPVVYGASEFAGVARAQDYIRLANGADVKHEKPADASVIHKFEDETVGWEGGFYAAMFWNLGRPSLSEAAKAAAESEAAVRNKRLRKSHQQHLRGSRSPSSGQSDAEVNIPPSEDTLRVRSLVGRSYMMDLAVLAEASDTIVCAVSSTGCRMLAVMMGWEKAMVQGQWINIDGDYGWWPVDL